MPTASAIGKAYCPQCGWNRAEAEKRTRLLLRLLPVLVIVFDAPLIIWIFIGHAELPALAALGVLAIVPAILVVFAVRGKVRIESLPPSRPGAMQTSTDISSGKEGSAIAAPSDEAAAQEYGAMNRILAELQRPRTVRMSRQGKINITVILIALLAFAAALIAMAVLQPAAAGGNITPRSRALVTLLPFGLVTAIVFVMRRSLAQQRGLLTLGEVVLARVTKQWAARNGNGVRYEFTAPTGETFSRMTTDGARRLLVGMDLPIFYDPQQPKKQVALCASFYEVVLPGEK